MIYDRETLRLLNLRPRCLGGSAPEPSASFEARTVPSKVAPRRASETIAAATQRQASTCAVAARKRLQRLTTTPNPQHERQEDDRVQQVKQRQAPGLPLPR